MLNKVLETPIDSLVELVKNNDNCNISFLKNKLNLPVDIIEKWLVILEEYKVLKVHYKGFEGYVQINQDEKLKDEKKEIELDKLKDMFIESSRKKNISYSKMKELWSIFVLEQEEEIKTVFYEKAKIKGINEIKTKKAWSKFRSDLVVF